MKRTEITSADILKEYEYCIDVRGVEERQTQIGWIPSTLCLPLPAIEEGVYPSVKPDSKILMICRSGARSAKASDILLKNGYTNVTNMEGGTLKWGEKKLPLVFPSKETEFLDEMKKTFLVNESSGGGGGKMTAIIAKQIIIKLYADLFLDSDKSVASENLQKVFDHVKCDWNSPTILGLSNAVEYLGCGLKNTYDIATIADATSKMMAVVFAIQ